VDDLVLVEVGKTLCDLQAIVPYLFDLHWLLHFAPEVALRAVLENKVAVVVVLEGVVQSHDVSVLQAFVHAFLALVVRFAVFALLRAVVVLPKYL
jgi:hypothetical protein